MSSACGETGIWTRYLPQQGAASVPLHLLIPQYYNKSSLLCVNCNHLAYLFIYLWYTLLQAHPLSYKRLLHPDAVRRSKCVIFFKVKLLIQLIDLIFVNCFPVGIKNSTHTQAVTIFVHITSVNIVLIQMFSRHFRALALKMTLHAFLIKAI